MVRKIITGIIMLALVMTGQLSGSFIADAAGTKPTERHIEIDARKFAYTPGKIVVNKGDKVTIDVISHDVTHGFYLDGYGIKMKARPAGDGATVTFVADKTGKFWFRCSETCGVFHPFMIGEFVVEPNSRFPSSVGLAIGLAAASIFYVARRKPVKNDGSANQGCCSTGKGE